MANGPVEAAFNELAAIVAVEICNGNTETKAGLPALVIVEGFFREIMHTRIALERIATATEAAANVVDKRMPSRFV